MTMLKKLASFLFISLISLHTLAEDKVILCPPELTINLEIPSDYKGPEFYSKVNFIGAHYKNQILDCYYGAGRIKIEKKIDSKFCSLKETTSLDQSIKNSPTCLGTRVQCSLICR